MRVMRKTRAIIAAAAQAYMEEIAASFPGVESEVVSKPVAGADVWIRVKIPIDKWETFTAVLDTTVELNDRYYRERNVNIVATVVDKEAAFV
jgi:DNA-binding transcriptional MocR family regulator